MGDQIRDADLVVLVTDHDDFDYASIERATKLIFDTRDRFRALRVGNVEHLCPDRRVTAARGCRTLKGQ